MPPPEASDYLWNRHRIRRSVRRLAQLRATGEGPPYRRDGLVAVLYPPDLLDAWAEQQLGQPVRSTAEESARRTERTKLQPAVAGADPPVAVTRRRRAGLAEHPPDITT
jgi:hypothetical protein